METITFICVNYNNSEYSESFCRSLFLQKGLNTTFKIRCLVVDNSSDPDNTERLKSFCSQFDWITFIESGSNLGYFGGLNNGLLSRPQDHSAFVVICNNDLEFDEFFCSELIKIERDDSVFAICPDIITRDGTHQNPHVVVPINIFRRIKYDIFFSHYYAALFLTCIKRLIPKKVRYSHDLINPIEIHMGIGACYILTSSFFKHFENLHCPVFLYGEEAFFSAQIHSKKGRLIFNPRLKVKHAESAAFVRVPKRIAYEYAREGYPLYRKLI